MAKQIFGFLGGSEMPGLCTVARRASRKRLGPKARKACRSEDGRKRRGKSSLGLNYATAMVFMA